MELFVQPADVQDDPRAVQIVPVPEQVQRDQKWQCNGEAYQHEENHRHELNVPRFCRQSDGASKGVVDSQKRPRILLRYFLRERVTIEILKRFFGDGSVEKHEALDKIFENFPAKFAPVVPR